MVQLVEISTLGVTVPSVHVNVADLGYGVDGVLGMNFLLDFNIEIRPGARRIVVERIMPEGVARLCHAAADLDRPARTRTDEGLD